MTNICFVNETYRLLLMEQTPTICISKQADANALGLFQNIVDATSGADKNRLIQRKRQTSEAATWTQRKRPDSPRDHSLEDKSVIVQCLRDDTDGLPRRNLAVFSQIQFQLRCSSSNYLQLKCLLSFYLYRLIL